MTAETVDVPEAMPTPTQDERIMSALSHISILLPMTGVLVPIVVWITQKDKSRFVTFQALQAVALHLTLIVGWFAGMACYFGSFVSMFAGMSLFRSSNSSGGPEGFVALPFLTMGAVLCVGVLFVLYGVVAAVLTFQGKDFRYLVIGNLLARQLNKSQTSI